MFGKIQYSSPEELEQKLAEMEPYREKAYQKIDEALREFKEQTGVTLLITVKKAPPGRAFGLMIVVEG